jgi:DNA-binding response OmpR family regulator/Tfp pilus assembly protein PilF
VPEALHTSTLRARIGTSTRALIVDGHATARQILATQLRAMGMAQVVQCAKAQEARQHASQRPFDVLLCEQRLGDGTLGQDLIDELRQRRLVTLSTIVMVLSANSTYPVVAEAAELAIDGFLIKPYRLGYLEDRLLAAYRRKDSLREITTAIDEGRDADALEACEARFGKRGPYWSHAARLGAELAIRLDRLPLANTLYQAVLKDKAVPWARLGIARVLDASGQATTAVSTIKNLLGSQPSYADAYDVLGRIYTERGDYAAAVETFRRAVEVTPHSVARNQKYGILTYYAGDRAESLKVLARVIDGGGLTAPDFDHHVVLLLAVDSFRKGDRQVLQDLQFQLRAAADSQRTVGAQAQPAAGDDAGPDAEVRSKAHEPRSQRTARYAQLVAALAEVLGGNATVALRSLEQVYQSMEDAEAGVDAAIAFLLILSTLCQAGVHVTQASSWSRSLGLRYCTSKQVTELLSRACEAFPALAEPVRAAHAHIGAVTRQALGDAVAGQPRQAVTVLIDAIEQTHNLKLHEVATATLQRHLARIDAPEALMERLDALRERCGAHASTLLQARTTLL